MFTVAVFLLFSFAISSISTDTPFKDCGSEAGTIQTFVVTGCSTSPCKFAKGNTYAMNLTVQAKAPSKTATVKIFGVIGGVPVPFPLPESNGCKLGMTCPINQNDVNTASLSLQVLSSYPSISLYVKIELINDDQKQNYACIIFPAVITG